MNSVAVVTGATSVVGFHLIQELLSHGVRVHGICRRGSPRRKNLDALAGSHILELDMDEIGRLPEMLESANMFYHLAWEGGRNDFIEQCRNVPAAVSALTAARKLGVTNFIGSGSQAEYGSQNQKVNEDTEAKPETAYGASKLAAYRILELQARQSGVRLFWPRLFSVYGRHDHPNKIVPYLLGCLRRGISPELSSGEQPWEFLAATDAAKALALMGTSDKPGIYNVASGESRPLKAFLTEARDLLNPGVTLKFGSVSKETVSLNANTDRIHRELGWRPQKTFAQGIKELYESM